MAKKKDIKKKKSFEDLLKGWKKPNDNDNNDNGDGTYITVEQFERVVEEVLLTKISNLEDKLNSNNKTIESMETFLGSDEDDDDYDDDDEDLSKIERENNRFYNKYGGQ